MVRGPRKPVARRRPARRQGASRNGQRTQATKVLAQGVAKVTPQPFSSDVTFDAGQGLDATIPKHLPLPRPVAGYTVVRLTKRFTSGQALMVFGTFSNEFQASGQAKPYSSAWSQAIAVGTSSFGTTLNANTTNWDAFLMPGGLFESAQASIVPAAYTIQIMNPEALQTTTGIVYGSVMRQKFMPTLLSRTGQTYRDQLIATNPPRLCSAAKLALRGVTVNLAPFNMSALADFRQTKQETTAAGAGVDGDVQFSSGGTAFLPVEAEGFQPAYVINPSSISLEYLVTVEYRVRFDPFNMAAASHKMYPSAPLSVWDQAVRMADNLGHGIRDIAEVVANNGEAVGAAVRAGRVIARAAAAA